MRWPWRRRRDLVEDLSKIHLHVGLDDDCRACGNARAHPWHAYPLEVATLANVDLSVPCASGSFYALAQAVLGVDPGAAVWQDFHHHVVFVEASHHRYWQAIRRAAWWEKLVGAVLVVVWFGAVTYPIEETERWLDGMR
jgi:hypothetical protein